MSIPSEAEIKFFETVCRTANLLRGTRHPQWYLRARLDQMLDTSEIPHRQREDVAARAFFILCKFAEMEAITKLGQRGAFLSG